MPQRGFRRPFRHVTPRHARAANPRPSDHPPSCSPRVSKCQSRLQQTAPRRRTQAPRRRTKAPAVGRTAYFCAPSSPAAGRVHIAFTLRPAAKRRTQKLPQGWRRKKMNLNNKPMWKCGFNEVSQREAIWSNRRIPAHPRSRCFARTPDAPGHDSHAARGSATGRPDRDFVDVDVSRLVERRVRRPVSGIAELIPVEGRLAMGGSAHKPVRPPIVRR